MFRKCGCADAYMNLSVTYHHLNSTRVFIKHHRLQKPTSDNTNNLMQGPLNAQIMCPHLTREKERMTISTLNRRCDDSLKSNAVI